MKVKLQMNNCNQRVNKILPITSEISGIIFVANMLGWDIVVNEFEIQSRYYAHFRTNTLTKNMNPFLSLQPLVT